MVNIMAGSVSATRWSHKNYEQQLITHITWITVFVIITRRKGETY